MNKNNYLHVLNHNYDYTTVNKRKFYLYILSTCRLSEDEPKDQSFSLRKFHILPKKGLVFENQ